MTTDDETLRRYREASAALDERPAPAARAAILAAAAREVNAKPRAADAPRGLRMRWPLAAAATVMLSTLAVMMATRTQEEMPTFTAPADSAPASAPVAPAPPSAPTPPSAPAPGLSTAPASPKVEAPGARMQRPAQTRAAPTTPSRQEGQLRETRPSSPEAPAARDAERGAAAEPGSPPAPAAPVPMRDAPSLQRGMAADAAKPSAAPMDRRREADEAAAPAVELTAAQWLERIVELRAAGRHDEADTELKRFSERYPQVQVPAAARGPTATR